jgi:hypothetical protein
VKEKIDSRKVPLYPRVLLNSSGSWDFLLAIKSRECPFQTSYVAELLLIISFAKTNEGTYKMSSKQLWNEFSTIHDIREKYDQKDVGLSTELREVGRLFAKESDEIAFHKGSAIFTSALSTRPMKRYIGRSPLSLLKIKMLG